MTAAISLVGVTLNVGKATIVEDLCVELGRSSRTALLGTSGSGKTTLLRAIAGFLRPTKGEIFLNGRNAADIPPEERDVAMLFQEPVLFPRLTVRENARAAIGPGQSRIEVDTHIESLARVFLMGDHADRRIDDGLSGGERQRAALVRAFATKRGIVLLDEPLKGAISIGMKWKLLHAIRTQITNSQATALVVTHDFAEAAFLADDLLVLHDNGIARGSPAELYERPPSTDAALVLGPANKITVEQLRRALNRDASFPLVVNGTSPETKGETDSILFRPEKVTIAESERGFHVIDERFLGNLRRVLLRAPDGSELEAHLSPVGPSMKTVTVTVNSRDLIVFSPMGIRR